MLSITMKQKVTDNDIESMIETSDMKALNIYMDHVIFVIIQDFWTFEAQ